MSASKLFCEGCVHHVVGTIFTVWTRNCTFLAYLQFPAAPFQDYVARLRPRDYGLATYSQSARTNADPPAYSLDTQPSARSSHLLKGNLSKS